MGLKRDRCGVTTMGSSDASPLQRLLELERRDSTGRILLKSRELREFSERF